MASGLDVAQSLTADWTSVFNPSSQMEFDMPDMAAFAALRETGAPFRVDLEIYQRQHLAALAHHPRSRKR